MNYPIWELTTLGGGTLIALISIVHVYIAHLAVGGGAFIWLTDLKGYRENSKDIHTYVRKHTWFFLLLTMVFGGLTGVGIWFIISLVNPAGTSKLIHAFVFGWAIEWVFFVGEISSLLIYHYQFEKLERKGRLLLAFLYFLFAWLSLVIINGILSFMLTPGKWLETQGFWDGFFNPTYFSSLFFRTFVAMMFAGLFGYVTSVYLKAGEFRNKMLRYCSKWLLYPLIGLIPSGIWYYFSVPAAIRETTFVLNPQTAPFVTILIVSTVLIFLAGIYFIFKSGRKMQQILTFVLVAIGLCWMGGFEYIREIARKPFVIYQFMFTNSLMTTDLDRLNKEGVLTNAKWTEIKEITPENRMEAGKELFKLQCSSCHTVGGIRNDILPRIEKYPYMGVLALLDGQGKILNYMPPFIGTEVEKKALAAYMTTELNQMKILETPEPFPVPQQHSEEIPAFDSKKDEYVLLVWNDLGMHCVTDGDPWFVILPPANTLEAQLIKRGNPPIVISEGIKISYSVEAGYENPSKHVDFWKYAKIIFGADLKENTGLTGSGLKGDFTFEMSQNAFVAKWIPVVPYRDDGTFNPYPLFSIEARDVATGEILAKTRVVAPNSTEMGCRNCHGGDWRVNGVAGLSAETGSNILEVHDRLSGTNLLEEAKKGQPKLCQSCHEDVAVGAKGDSLLLNMSAAIHGWHANYMNMETAEACALCHPANPEGNTRCARGVHGALEVTCVECHGTIAEHALGLLKGQKQKRGSARLMKHLESNQVASKADINPRMPWVKQPDCLNCHVDYEQPISGASGYNQWTAGYEELYRVRTDNAGIRCEACHGATHALYPANNIFGWNRDNLQPMQYNNLPFPIGSNQDCQVCHTEKIQDPIHHENMMREFRNTAKFQNLIQK
ncbi:c-type cytochrome [candidate division KSB1 bacterium]|nr:c-type cytochrome [candidate division KSB1 bacterium]